MAILYVQKKKTQRNLILVFSAVCLITAFVVWRGFFKEETGSSEEGGLLLPRQEARLDFEILKSPLLKALQLFPDIQPFEESTTTEGRAIIKEELGRENPFMPY